MKILTSLGHLSATMSIIMNGFDNPRLKNRDGTAVAAIYKAISIFSAGRIKWAYILKLLRKLKSVIRTNNFNSGKTFQTLKFVQPSPSESYLR